MNTVNKFWLTEKVFSKSLSHLMRCIARCETEVTLLLTSSPISGALAAELCESSDSHCVTGQASECMVKTRKGTHLTDIYFSTALAYNSNKLSSSSWANPGTFCHAVTVSWQGLWTTEERSYEDLIGLLFLGFLWRMKCSARKNAASALAASYMRRSVSLCGV